MSEALLPAILALKDLHEGQIAAFQFSVSQSDMHQFADLSGDFNPLHLDEAFARSKGFSGAVVFGGLIIAKISRLIGMHLPGRDSIWSSVDLQFRNPLYVAQTADLTASIASISESTGMVEIKITVRAEGELLAKGKVEVLVVAE